jgi:hypothetical protein
MKIPNLVDAIETMYKKDSQSFPARSIRASAIGNPCARCLAYDQLMPGGEISPRLAGIFALGRTLEDQAVADFTEALKGTDVDIIRDRMSLPVNKYNIGGKVDWWIAFTPEGATDHRTRMKIPAEFKSMSPFSFDEIHSMEDMLSSRKTWVRKYPAQLLTYMILTSTEFGLFILRNKVTGEYRQINVTLDDKAITYCEELLKRAETVRDAVEAYRKSDTDAEKNACLPPRIDFDPDACQNCDHFKTCLPDITQAPSVVNLISDIELEAWCRIREQNEQAVKAYGEADDKIKAHVQAMCVNTPVKGKTTGMTMSYFVVGSVSEIERVVDLPELQKKTIEALERPFIKKIRQVRKSIKKIDEVPEV